MRTFSVRIVVLLSIVAAVASFWPLALPVAAQSASETGGVDAATLKSDLDKLRQEVEDLRGEVRVIREFLRQRLAQPQPNRPPQRVEATASIGAGPALGSSDAPLTLIEFSDYQCPFCRKFVDATLPELKKQYVESGKLRIIYRDFPLEQLHPQARTAAVAARCAGEQGKYWPMHDVLFQNQDALMPDRLRGYAERVGADGQAFQTCLESGKYDEAIQKDYADGMAAGVRGTPSFVLGKTRPDGTVAGLLIVGAHPAQDFRQEIERLLESK